MLAAPLREITTQNLAPAAPAGPCPTRPDPAQPGPARPEPALPDLARPGPARSGLTPPPRALANLAPGALVGSIGLLLSPPIWKSDFSVRGRGGGTPGPRKYTDSDGSGAAAEASAKWSPLPTAGVALREKLRIADKPVQPAHAQILRGRRSGPGGPKK